MEVGKQYNNGQVDHHDDLFKKVAQKIQAHKHDISKRIAFQMSRELISDLRNNNYNKPGNRFRLVEL